MDATTLELNEKTMAFIDELGGHMPGGFFIYKAKEPEELIYANKPVFDIYGCDGPEDFRQLTGGTFRGMVHPEDYRQTEDAISDQIQKNENHMDYAEYRIIRKDGAIRWVDDFGHYLETANYGGIFTVFISDITEKHERIASDLADQRAAIADQQATIADHQATIADHQATIANHQATIANHQATIEALSDSFQKAQTDRIAFSRIAQALAADYFCIYVVDPDTDSFVEYSASGEYEQLGIEKSGEDFFGLSRAHMEKLIYPEDRDRFMAVFIKERVLSILRRDGIFTTKYRLMLNGEPTYISMKATLLEDENGSHLVIGANNIDAQMKREQEFQRRMAEAKISAKNDFLANMSHDIRTPMNAIVGYTNIATTHLHDHQKVRDSLEKIGSSSHFLLSLINDILDISKIESGKMQLSQGPCNLGDIFHRIEDITALQARNKSLLITYDHEKVTHYLVNADELRIEQILINIISNAIKYTPAGKQVDLISEEESLPDGNRNRYRFIVRDTGVGINEDYLPHIFDSFTREQNTTINSVQGTGLGLAITAKVVELMGGTISVKSKLGEGSEFTVEIDLESLEEPEPEAEEKDEAIDLVGNRALLVEDNDINAEIARLILEQNGMIIEHAKNGQIALDMIRDGEPGLYQVVLMDIQMPVMNGYEATRAIRALEGDYFKNISILAMSANAYDEDIQACLDAGMNAHIAKPFNPDELLKLIHKHI